MTDMTPAQGRFLTALLDDLTAAAPKAGTEARTRLREQFAAGRLDKAEASRSIDVLKRAIALAKGTAPVPAPRAEISEREAVMLEARRAQAATLRKGKPAPKRRSARPAGGGLMDALRTWTPERSAALLADAEGLPF